MRSGCFRFERRLAGCSLACLALAWAAGIQAEHPRAAITPLSPSPDVADTMPFQLPHLPGAVPTLGGRQFWGDVQFDSGWRIQHNVLTDSYRLLDPEDVRHALGDEAACRAALERIKAERQIPAMSGRAVILLHGIIRSSKSMNALARRLKEEGYTIVGFDYPSTQVSIADSARYLQRVIDSLHGIEQIDIVAHSMGGLVVRSYVQLSHGEPDPRIQRMVMLGVPNTGARMATMLQSNLLFRWIYGPAGQELVDVEDGFIVALPAPPFEFSIIAGARGVDSGWNPLIPGDDDGTISVECTKLPGASDFITVPALHTIMMANRTVVDATVRYLQTGAFREDGERHPLPVVVAQQPNEVDPNASIIKTLPTSTAPSRAHLADE